MENIRETVLKTNHEIIEGFCRANPNLTYREVVTELFKSPKEINNKIISLTTTLEFLVNTLPKAHKDNLLNYIEDTYGIDDIAYGDEVLLNLLKSKR